MRKYLTVVILPLAIVAAACGGKGSSMLPASPSPAPGGSPGSAGSAIVGGSISASSSSGAAFSPAAMSALTVAVVGTSVSSSVSAAGDFTLRNVPAGDISVKVSGPGADAVVTITGVAEGASIQVKISIKGNQGSLDFDSRGGASGKVELEGLIESKTAPDMLVVGGQSVKVATTADIRHGGTSMTFASLTVGWRVHVRGTMSAPGVVPSLLTADLIIVQDMNVGATNKIDGQVAAILSGSCSSFPFKFTVGATTVATTAATDFHPECSALSVGVMVHVEGQIQADGSLLASKVNIDATEVDITGTVGAITGGTCGAFSLAFSVNVTSPAGTKQVKTNAFTEFKPACSSVIVGASVDVSGFLQADGSILAKKVNVETGGGGGGGGGQISLHGTISALAGTCPSLTFTLAGTTPVKTDSSTSFKPPSSCGGLKNTDTVTVQGMLVSGTLMASRVERN